MVEQISAAQFHDADGVEDWRVLYHLVSAHFRTGSLAAGVALAEQVSRLAGDAERYLKVDLRQGGVTVSMSVRDVALARDISAAARKLGLSADPTAVQVIGVTIDVLLGPQVMPFWRAVLGYGQIDDDYLFDPQGRWPGVGFQRMHEARPQRNRIHLDVAVPHEQAEARVAAAIAAGGRLVSDEHAPKWWVLADAEGNEACVATWVGRG